MNGYEQFDNHFCDITAAAIFQGPTQVGKIAVKHTKAGVAHVYLHAFGHNMIYGKASGYGNDKVGRPWPQSSQKRRNFHHCTPH